ncbi:FmdB family zinc ribbon protein [Thiocystis violascens]|uniref:Putative regulatory protein, FmdB family n=1 Tax=Thiocystis violascens (strain ATCC 17096 / DSM 198 / 6111) TaxID=765911 RepID=I3Y6D2_THIV6|nr:zinc ribbon domain-containing protein [Thiocystis violascens]AFL72550.1 putative regulatory protein, FmdB family [Thiocystis violascens DSM 198]
MPIYEYRCESCGHELEKIQKVSDPALADCPACGQPTLKKQISAAGFRLKGSGWYETDFKKDKQKNLHDSGEKGEKTTAKSADKTVSSTTAGAGQAATVPATSSEKKTVA